MPQIAAHPDQANLIYEGNIETCLSNLDANVLAAGKLQGVKHNA